MVPEKFLGANWLPVVPFAHVQVVINAIDGHDWRVPRDTQFANKNLSMVPKGGDLIGQ